MAKTKKKSNKITKTGPHKVRMVNPSGSKPTRHYRQTLTHIGQLGREIKISPKSAITVNKPGFKVEFFDETVSVLIGIGKNHTADVIMSKDAWQALNNGAEINIDTPKDLKKTLAL